jgi:hypothetical protein
LKKKYFNVSSWIETVQLVDEFEHSALDFVVTTGSIVETGASDGVNFVEKDQTGLFGAGHFEEFAYHASSLTDILLDQFRADDSDEAGIRSVSYCSGAQRLARARWTKQ